MEILDYILKIREIIKTERDYDSYSYIFKEYILFLEELLRKDPSNIKAICQLAIAYYEDRRDTDICINLMEDALKKFELDMSKDYLTELLNNLACFYDIEYGEFSKAEQILKRAIKLESNFQSSYYALAYITAESDPKYALKVMNSIPKKDNLSIDYQYLFAYILMRNGEFDEALRFFDFLSHCSNKEVIEKSLYNIAILYSKMGKIEEGTKIADKLYKGYKEGRNEEILTFELIYLYFILQNYEKVIGLFSTEKTENILIDVHIIKLYFYALKKLGLEIACEEIYTNKIGEIKNTIEEIKSDTDYSENEKLEYINSYESDLKILFENYSDVISKNMKVEVDDELYYCKYRKCCYFIDCPRHS